MHAFKSLVAAAVVAVGVVPAMAAGGWYDNNAGCGPSSYGNRYPTTYRSNYGYGSNVGYGSSYGYGSNYGSRYGYGGYDYNRLSHNTWNNWSGNNWSGNHGRDYDRFDNHRHNYNSNISFSPWSPSYNYNSTYNTRRGY